MQQFFVTFSHSLLRETSHSHGVRRCEQLPRDREDNNKTISNVLQGQERPSEFDADQETTRATWTAANQDLYSVLFWFSVLRGSEVSGQNAS